MNEKTTPKPAFRFYRIDDMTSTAPRYRFHWTEPKRDSKGKLHRRRRQHTRIILQESDAKWFFDSLVRTFKP